MKHPHRASLALGFLAASALAVCFWVVQNAGFKGGHVSTSPTGRYTLRLFAPLSPKYGGSYEIDLLEQPDDQFLQKVVITMPRSKETAAVRDGGATVTWDVAETYADIFVDSRLLIRVPLPDSDTVP